LAAISAGSGSNELPLLGSEAPERCRCLPWTVENSLKAFCGSFEGWSLLALRAVEGKEGRYEQMMTNVVAKHLTSYESMTHVLARPAELMIELMTALMIELMIELMIDLLTGPLIEKALELENEQSLLGPTETHLHVAGLRG